jgi:hypothetical protein
MAQRPLITVVDRFYRDPQAVRRLALRASYLVPSGVTGWRSQPWLGAHIKDRLERLLHIHIDAWRSDPSLAAANGSFFCAFSNGSRAEVPEVHWDGPETMCTGVVYLTPDAPFDTGTSFWRHKATGLVAAPTTADARRLGLSRKALGDWLERDARKRSAWEETDRIGNQFNRAVFFKPNLLHSATKHFGGNVQSGRLYQSFHFDVAPKMRDRSRRRLITQ